MSQEENKWFEREYSRNTGATLDLTRIKENNQYLAEEWAALVKEYTTPRMNPEEGQGEIEGELTTSDEELAGDDVDLQDLFKIASHIKDVEIREYQACKCWRCDFHRDMDKE